MVGNTPNFSKLDILRCFICLDKKLSRNELAKSLELGEGTIRSILNILKAKELLNSDKKGHSLTKKGSEFLKRIEQQISRFKEIENKKFFPSQKKIGIIIKNIGKLIETYKLRDIAVKNGADGAILLEYHNKLSRLKDIQKSFRISKANLSSKTEMC